MMSFPIYTREGREDMTDLQLVHTRSCVMRDELLNWRTLPAFSLTISSSTRRTMLFHPPQVPHRNVWRMMARISPAITAKAKKVTIASLIVSSLS